MSRVGDLLDEWWEWHVRLGTLTARRFTPTPVSEHVLAEREADGAGAPWPEEVKDLYRWSDGNYLPILPFGDLNPISVVASEDANDNFNFDNPRLSDEENAVVRANNPSHLVRITMAFPVIHIDIGGLTPGRVRGLDIGEWYAIADSLTDYLEAIVYLANNNMIDEQESSVGLVLKDLGRSWGPPTS